MSNTLYKEELLEHYKNPQNFGELAEADVIVEDHNPLCGDRQKWYIKLKVESKKSKVRAVSFTGDGCAISMAAASMLSEVIKGKSKEEIEAMNEHDMMELLGVQVSPGRIKCLMLPLVILKQGFRKH